MAASTEVRRLRATPSDTKHLDLPRGAAGAMDAPSALQVGVGGALGPRHGPSQSVADLKTLLQRQGATTLPRTDLRPNDLFNF